MATAVCVVDMLNPYEHEDADRLTANVERVVEPIAALVERAGDQGVEIIYVNDNYGDWNSSQEELAERAMAGRRPDLVEPLLPPEIADFVIKARHTIFYMTPLEYLLSRHLRVTVPPDGVAHIHEDLADAALKMMERNMRAELTACAECTLED
jgi:nicotinamidase-related amidase